MSDLVTPMDLTCAPGIVIGNYLMPGAVDLETLRKAIVQVRAEKRSASQS